MNDRELLEMAAKAAGITLRWIQGPNDDECIHPTRAELKGYFDRLEQNLHNFDQKLEHLADRLTK